MNIRKDLLRQYRKCKYFFCQFRGIKRIIMIQHIKLIEVILYVSNQEKSKDFYEHIFRMKADLHVPGMTEFIISGNCKLGLMHETGIAKLLAGKTPHPSSGNGIPRCELY